MRKSGTEPIIKVALEANDKQTHDEILAELKWLLVNLGCEEE